MADELSPQDQGAQQQREFRRVVSNAVQELRSAELRSSFTSVSLEELIDQRVAQLEGSTSDTSNPGRLQRIRRVRQELTDNIEAMKATPPEAFRRHDPDGDANTAPDSEDEG